MGFSFQTRIVLLFSLLFVAVQALTLTTVYRTAKENVLALAGQNLIYAGRVFDRLLSERGDGMADEAAILSADFGFRSTITSGDTATMRSALQNLVRRVGAHRAFYLDLENTVRVDTEQRADGQIFIWRGAIEEAENEGRSVFLATVDQRPNVLAIVPILAPVAVGWVAIATEVDDGFMAHFQRLSPSSLEITLTTPTSDGAQIFSSTIAGLSLMQGNAPSMGAASQAESTRIVEFADRSYLTLVHPLPTARGEQALLAVLQIDLDHVLEPYHQFWFSAAVLFALGIGATLLGGYGIARQVSRPVQSLAAAVNRVREGDFSQGVKWERRDELGSLAETFNDMMFGIADRERLIAHQQRHDPITGLANRLFFEERLTIQGEQGNSFAVMLVGVDRYSEITITLGHELGDKLIQTIGSLLQQSMPVDAILARMASDQFALMVHSPGDEGSLRHLAELILQSFEAPIALGPTTVDISARIGIVQCPKDGCDVRTLLRKADAALYVARRRGHGCELYRTESDPCQPEALSLMSELRAGLERGDFTLYVQPLLDLRTGRVTQVECLIRWVHPERGFMSPDCFISQAEQTGHISRVTSWVLREAFRLRTKWQAANLDIKLAINLSTKDLFPGHLLPLLDELLTSHRVAAGDFLLEITEGAVMQDAEAALRVLEELYGRGFQLAVDDFGTGYSSMAYLKKLPLNELKIDKSFVLNLADNPEDAMICRSVIDLGHNLGLNVVAEGLEDEASLTLLTRLGCDLVQGYWYSRPMPADDFEEWFQRKFATCTTGA